MIPVVLQRTAMRAARSALVWSLVFALYVVNSSYTYATSYPTAASRAAAARLFTGNAAYNALVGIAHHLDTVAGFTNWKILGFLTVVGAAWGLLLASRSTRGEEDAGRWELLLAGTTTRRRALVEAEAGVGCGIAVLFAVTAGAAAGIGTSARVAFSVSSALFLATALVAGAAVFAAVGLLASQLAASRLQANAIAAGALGVSFVIRMAADSSDGFGWLRWATPLGWIENLRPLIGSDPVPFVPLVLLIAATTAAAVTLAGRRDLEAAVLASHDGRDPRTGMLGGHVGLAIRLGRNVDGAWVGALAAMGLLFGLVTRSAAAAIRDSTGIARAIERLGGRGAGSRSYLGVTLLIVSAIVAFAAVGQIAAARDEEAQGRLDHVMVGPVRRWRWLTARLGVGAGLVLVASMVTVAAAWAGAASQDSGVGVVDLLSAGLAMTGPGLFVLGFGALLLGVIPRISVTGAYAVVAWSLVIEMLGSVFTANRFLADTSLLAHLRPAPAVPPDWGAAAAMACLGLLMAMGGVAGFCRRDLVPA